MPFAGYADHAACVRANSSKRDPDAYCASIARAVEGKSAAYQEAFSKALEHEDTGWLDVRDWHNDRTHAAFINDALTDLQGDRVTLDAQVLAMPQYAAEGFLEWMHGQEFPGGPRGPPVKIGRPIGWRVKDQKAEVRWGIYDRDDMMGLPLIDEKWAEIQKGGTFSMTFLPVTEYVVQEGGRSVREISSIHLQSVGFVKAFAASPGAISTGKTSMIIMKAIDLDSVSRETQPIPDHIHASPTEGGHVETLKTGSGYARPGRPMAGEEAKKAEEAAAKIKELEAELAKATKEKDPKPDPKPTEKQPPEGGCPDGKKWDPDAGECVDEEDVSAHEESITRKEFDELLAFARENRELSKRILQEGLPDPEKAFREELEKALQGQSEDVQTAVLGVADKVYPPKEQKVEDRVKTLVDEIVGAKMQEVNAAQTKAMVDLDIDVREKMNLPARKPHGKPDTSGGTGATSAEAAADRLVTEANEAAQKRRENPAAGRW